MNDQMKPGAAGPVNVSSYEVGQVVRAVSARYEAKKTEPPPRYTMDSLLDDMLAAHKFAKTPQDREILKRVEGLGTSRTRVPMVENAVRRGFLVSTKKGKKHELRASEMAKAMMQAFPPLMKDVAMTAKWEVAFSMVERGEVALPVVIDKAYAFVSQVVETAKSQRGQIKISMPGTAGGSGGGSSRARRP